MMVQNIRVLFRFIKVIHSNIDNLNQHGVIIPRWKINIWKQAQLGTPFSGNKEWRDMQRYIDRDWDLISKHIIIPLKNHTPYSAIGRSDNPEKFYRFFNHLIIELVENHDQEDVAEIKNAMYEYVEFKNNINPNITELRELHKFFNYLDIVMSHIIKEFWDDGDKVIPTKQNTRIEMKKTNPLLKERITKSEDATVVVAGTPNDSNIKKTPQIKSLFNFIDFLHGNIDTFNQYDNVILKLKKMRERFSQLGFHFTEVREKKALEKEINEKWDVIFENIVNPIKDKVAELDLFDWSAPETLSNNYFHIANRLSKTYDEKDLDEILNAKRQYIEFTNEISLNVIKQNHILFEYLQEVMVEIAKNFEEVGDKSIKKIEVKQVETFQELIDSFNAGEIASLPLHINSSDTVSIQSNLNVPYSKIENNTEPTIGNTMDVNYERIFEIALNYADDLEEMKAFCIREQKKADRDYFYEKDDFYKSLMKVVADKKELAKYQPAPMPTHIGSFFIAGGGGSGYNYESIELVEQIIYEICKEDTVSQLKVNERKDSKKSGSKMEDENHTIGNTPNPESFDIPLSDDELAKHYNKLVKTNDPILHEETDFHHFRYAISGHEIPKDKQPYKAIKLSDYNKSFYNYLNDEIVQSQKLKPQKSLPNIYKRKARKLFINRYGKPLGLSNPN